MESRTVLFDGELFECISFFDVDTQEEGIEVTYLENNSLVGEIIGISIPDEEDDEEITAFEECVTAWLNMQDINYNMD